MLLKLNGQMKLTYLLAQEFKQNPDYMITVQATTLDKSKPNFGLSGRHGLFGSTEWWDNIENGTIPLQFDSGLIQRAYFSGQDSRSYNNTITILLDNGRTEDIGIYVNKKSDANLFKVGHRVQIVYALDKLKPTAARSYGEPLMPIVLEMAVSLEKAI